ncbi:hypothetical protein NHX12_021635 [Muraenolepis orangiensis]|uniref:OTU domain-containing protein 1 n=1 Tax=Muraenolepis orangiensis TaxID=630683 RepID=A0A9Q0IVB1_9TELE|nr:hypothetical protein NHX12_021635 [Muraenolepis orangiensis]
MQQHRSSLTHFPRTARQRPSEPNRTQQNPARNPKQNPARNPKQNPARNSAHAAPSAPPPPSSSSPSSSPWMVGSTSVRSVMPEFVFYEAVPLHPGRFTATAQVTVRRPGERSLPIHVMAPTGATWGGETRGGRRARSPVSPGTPDLETDLMLACLLQHLSDGTEERDSPFGPGNASLLFGTGTGGETGIRNPDGPEGVSPPPPGEESVRREVTQVTSTAPGKDPREERIRDQEPLPLVLRDEKPLPLVLRDEKPLPRVLRDEEPLPLVLRDEKPLPRVLRDEEPLPLVLRDEEPLPLVLQDEVSLHLAEVEAQDAYLKERNKFRFRVIPDGNCLYRAVSRATSGDQAGHGELRERTVHHIADHLELFGPVMEGDVGEFLIAAAQDGAWAGYPELLAMSQMLGVRVHLTTGGGARSPTISTMMHDLGGPGPRGPDIWLSWLSNGHYDVILDRDVPNPRYRDWCLGTQAQRGRDQQLAHAMAASLSRMYLEQNRTQ